MILLHSTSLETDRKLLECDVKSEKIEKHAIWEERVKFCRVPADRRRTTVPRLFYQFSGVRRRTGEKLILLKSI